MGQKIILNDTYCSLVKENKGKTKGLAPGRPFAGGDWMLLLFERIYRALSHPRIIEARLPRPRNSRTVTSPRGNMQERARRACLTPLSDVRRAGIY